MAPNRFASKQRSLEVKSAWFPCRPRDLKTCHLILMHSWKTGMKQIMASFGSLIILMAIMAVSVDSLISKDYVQGTCNCTSTGTKGRSGGGGDGDPRRFVVKCDRMVSNKNSFWINTHYFCSLPTLNSNEWECLRVTRMAAASTTKVARKPSISNLSTRLVL